MPGGLDEAAAATNVHLARLTGVRAAVSVVGKPMTKEPSKTNPQLSPVPVAPQGDGVWRPPALSWSGVRRYGWRRVRRSWAGILSGTLGIAALAIFIPWAVEGFTESGWDSVTGGTATWSLAAIPAWLVLIGVGYFLRAPTGYASEVVASYAHRLGEVQEELRVTTLDLERERMAAPIFGEAVIPSRIEKRLIRLRDLPPGIWLPSVTITDCDLVGPATLVVMGGTIGDNHFYGGSAETFVVSDTLGSYFADSIVLRNCAVAGCRFHNVTVIGDQLDIDVLRGDMVEAGPDTPDRVLGN